MKRVSPSMIIAILALIVSMSGGAYAATRVLITNIHQIGPGVRHQLRGQQGLAGTQGAAGPQGAAGTPGLVATVTTDTRFAPQHSTTVTVPAGGSVTATAKCADSTTNSVIASGGYQGTAGLVFYQNYPVSNVGWTAAATNPTGAPLTFTVWALCTSS